MADDRYPDSLPLHRAMTELVRADLAFWGTDHIDHQVPDGCRDGKHRPIFCLNCSDTFWYASADAEEIEAADILPVAALAREHPIYGTLAWVARRRGMTPIPEVAGCEDYIHAVAALDAMPPATPIATVALSSEEAAELDELKASVPLLHSDHAYWDKESLVILVHALHAGNPWQGFAIRDGEFRLAADLLAKFGEAGLAAYARSRHRMPPADAVAAEPAYAAALVRLGATRTSA